MTYTIIRNAPWPTPEQLGRDVPADCCDGCRNNDRPNQTTKIPETANYQPGMGLMAELGIGDALDTEKTNRNIFGSFYRAYDYLNNTKHEVFMVSPYVMRCLRIK